MLGADPSGLHDAGATRPDPDPELLAEGRAMRDALLRDLDGVPGLELCSLVGPGQRRSGTPAGHPLPGGGDLAGALGRHLRARPGAGVWIIAPETRGTLERLRSAARAAGGRLVGTPPEGVRRAAHRARLLRRLRSGRVPVPDTRTASSPEEARRAAVALGPPVVVKPGRGAGAAGTTRVEDPDRAARAWRRAVDVEPGLPPLVQSYVEGVPVSVLLLAAPGGTRPLSLNRQQVRFAPEARYLGGETPWPAADPAPALAAARRACRICGGLRGLVGVDLVLGSAGPVVLEINPRLTTSYLGLRAHLGDAPARAALELAAPGRGGPDAGARGSGPARRIWELNAARLTGALQPVVRGERVRFTASGNRGNPSDHLALRVGRGDRGTDPGERRLDPERAHGP